MLLLEDAFTEQQPSERISNSLNNQQPNHMQETTGVTFIISPGGDASGQTAGLPTSEAEQTESMYSDVTLTPKHSQ